jgi:hypothetical protein
MIRSNAPERWVVPGLVVLAIGVISTMCPAQSGTDDLRDALMEDESSEPVAPIDIRSGTEPTAEDSSETPAESRPAEQKDLAPSNPLIDPAPPASAKPETVTTPEDRSTPTPPAPQEHTPTEQAETAQELWETLQRLDVGSDEFAVTRQKLVRLIASLENAQRVPVATAMMQWGADDVTNATPLQEFFPDGFSPDALAPLVNNPRRSWKQRVLVRTYYKFLRPEYETAMTDKARLGLVELLTDRLSRLANAEYVSYGEQRLLSHMLQDTLSRYAGRAGELPAVRNLYAAMQTYAARPRTDDVLSLSINAWVEMSKRPAWEIESERDAMLGLGHWDVLVRDKSSTYLGILIMKDPAVGEHVFVLFDDPRDEVRAAAAKVFSFALSYQPDTVIRKMIDLLVNDRGVTVQKAAAETLICHSDEADTAISPLIDALREREPIAGPKRTTSILQTLSYLITPRTPDNQKQRVLDLAIEKLDFAPKGALMALQALGPFAKPAIPLIKQYRDRQADRFTRQTINRHVLMAIDPRSVRD